MKNHEFKVLLFLLYFLFYMVFQSFAIQINVKDIGATGIKTDDAREFIQQAIDSCYNAGGGEVNFPPGDYTSGTIVLKSNVVLNLHAGAILWASQDKLDYVNDFVIIKKQKKNEEPETTPTLIYAKNSENIGIIGKGKINGQARREYRDLEETDTFIEDITRHAREAGVEMKMYYKVPPFVCLIFIESCKDISLRDISLIESVSWSLHLKWSERVFIDNIYIETDLNAGVNADGIDLDGVRDVVITNSIISTGDDAIVLKTTLTDPYYQDCENITVSNCILTSTSTALKIGTETFGDFRNIIFSNCVVRNSNRGLSIVVRDGGIVENVLFTDITIETNRKHFNWWGNGDPIWIVLLKRNHDSVLGQIKNVTFRNIIAHGQGTSKIEGHVDQFLENIILDNVHLHMHPEEYLDKRADNAFSAHHVRDLHLDEIKVTWGFPLEPAWTNAFSFSDIENLHLEKLQGEQAHEGKGAMIRLSDVKKAIIASCYPTAGTFLELSGAASENIYLNNNYLFDSSSDIEIINGADRTAIKKYK